MSQQDVQERRVCRLTGRREQMIESRSLLRTVTAEEKLFRSMRSIKSDLLT